MAKKKIIAAHNQAAAPNGQTPSPVELAEKIFVLAVGLPPEAHQHFWELVRNDRRSPARKEFVEMVGLLGKLGRRVGEQADRRWKESHRTKDSERIERAKNLYKQGKTKAEIARELGEDVRQIRRDLNGR
jgi:hypothetical protein